MENSSIPNSLQGIEFSSPADALFARLFVEHDFAIGEATKTLENLRLVAYDQRRLSLRSLMDAYVGSSVRCAGDQSQQRLSKTALFNRSAGIPNVVLDLVVQYFSNMRVPFHDIAVEFPPSSSCTSMKALLNMSLVHRSWTIPSQRALAIRIHVHGVAGIQRALSSPSIGPWTREMLFTCATNPDIQEDFNGEIPSQVLPYLTALVNKLRNVQLLSVWTYFDEYNFDARLMRSFLQALKGLERLKGIWLSHQSFSGRVTCGTNPCLAELCLVIPELSSLEALYLDDWSVPARVPLRYIYPTQAYIHVPAWKTHKYRCPPPPAIEITPPKSMKTISLKWSARDEYPLQHVSWLLSARGIYSPQKFALTMQAKGRRPDDSDGDDHEEGTTTSASTTPEISCRPTIFLASIGRYLSAMTTVHLDLFSEYWNDEGTPLGFALVPLVGKCESAKQLVLSLHGDSSSEATVDLNIPAITETLCFKVERPYDRKVEEFLSQVDGVLVHFLETNSLPNLTKLTLLLHGASVASDGVDMNDATMAHNNRNLLGRTVELCNRKRAQFVFARVQSGTGLSLLPLY